MKMTPRSAPRSRSASSGRPSFAKSSSPFSKSADKRSEPRKPSAAGSGKKPAFGKGAPVSSESRSYSKRADARKTAAGGGFDKPKRFDRDSDRRDDRRERPERTERSERTERFAKPASRFAGKPAERKPYGERSEPRREGSFDKRPARTTRDAPAERTERFAKPASRFEGKPSHGKTYGEKSEPRREGGFHKKPSFGKGAPNKGRDFHAKSDHKPMRTVVTGSGKIMPKRDSLNRQGVLLWGLHAVREAWLNPERKCYRLWGTASGLEALEETLEQAKTLHLDRPDVLKAEKAEIEHFLPHGTVHQGVALEVEPLPELSLDDLLGQDPCPEIVIVLDQVTDPHNVGAILRSAAAFGAGAVIVTERNAPNATGTMAKTASGAAEHVPLISVVNISRTLEMLKAENFWCVGLAEEGKNNMAACKLSSGRIALVMGAEGEGLRRLTREHCDELARLPTQGRIGSLNVSNAAAVALYEAIRQKTGLIDAS